jgi:hypothetical protein
LACLAQVISLVWQCDVFQTLYMPPDLAKVQDVVSHLEESIVNAYYHSLLFLGFAIRHQQRKMRTPTAAFKLDDVETHFKKLVECGGELSQAAGICEKQCSHSNRDSIKALHDLAKDLCQIARSQAAQLGDMQETANKQLYTNILDIHRNRANATLPQGHCRRY